MHINDATIVESEVFVYNLGTMFYIDKILFANKDSLPSTNTQLKTTTSTEKTTIIADEKTTETTLTTKTTETFTTTITTTTEEVEKIPDELTVENGSMPDVLFADAEATTGGSTTQVDHEDDLKSTLSQNATVK